MDLVLELGVPTICNVLKGTDERNIPVMLRCGMLFASGYWWLNWNSLDSYYLACDRQLSDICSVRSCSRAVDFDI